MSIGAKQAREDARRRLAVALDVDDAVKARALAGALDGRCGWLKVGLQLFLAAGGPFVRELTNSGTRVFLDLKLHDIPNTVAGAATEAARLGAAMMTIHASGGAAMMRAAAEAVAREAAASGRPRPRVVAVTALTSLAESDLAEVGLLGPAAETCLRLALLARRSGCDGVVCSPAELGILRPRMGQDFLLVTPGIRPAAAPGAAPADDQRRTSTPSEAIRAGASVLVVGRPVTGAPDPAAAVEAILDGIAAAAGAAHP